MHGYRQRPVLAHVGARQVKRAIGGVRLGCAGEVKGALGQRPLALGAAELLIGLARRDRERQDIHLQNDPILKRVGDLALARRPTRCDAGRVLAQEILAKKVLVNYEDNRRVMVDAKDVLTVVSGSPSGGTKA